MKTVYFLLLLLFCSSFANSQQRESHKKQRKLIVKNYNQANKYLFSNLDSAKVYAINGLNLAKKIKDNSLKAKGYLTLSTIYHRYNDLPKAFEYVELAEILGGDLEDKKILANANFQKGTLFMVIGNEERAIELLGLAQNYFIKSKDSANLSVTYNSLSLLYKRTDDMDKAISMINESIAISRAINQKHALAASLGNLSTYYSAKDDNESALVCIRETLKLFTEIEGHGEIARSLISIGELFLNEKKYDSCTAYLSRAEKIIEEHNLLDPKLDLWTVKGMYEMEMHEYARALDYYTKAYELSTEFGISQLMQSSLESMYKSAKSMGNASLALTYLEQLKSMSDSLEQISGKEALVAFEINQKIENEKRLNEIEKDKLIAENKNSELTILNQNYLILSLILGGLIIIFIAYLLVRKRDITIGRKEDQKQELNDELELKNKELVSSAIQILRKSEEMKQTISSLQELNDRANPADSQLLLSIIRKLKLELEHSSWEEFEVPFKQLHSRFFTTLVEKYPQLTRAEIKVCALLKLDLDTKQISSILHKTPASIEVDRSRIRKKMGLTNKKTSLHRHISINV